MAGSQPGGGIFAGGAFGLAAACQMGLRELLEAHCEAQPLGKLGLFCKKPGIGLKAHRNRR